jgi:hypothetical protein
METIVLIEQAAALLTGLLNIAGATQRVSDLIAARVAAGRVEWTPEERAEIRAELDAARKYAQEQVDAANATEGSTPA